MIELWLYVTCLSLICVVLSYGVYSAGKKLGELAFRLSEIERRQGQGSKIPDEAVARLADPATLDSELERAGLLSEARRAKRRHLVRENAGPPAKVRKITIRRK